MTTAQNQMVHGEGAVRREPCVAYVLVRSDSDQRLYRFVSATAVAGVSRAVRGACCPPVQLLPGVPLSTRTCMNEKANIRVAVYS
jgi:hypothetical protein